MLKYKYMEIENIEVSMYGKNLLQWYKKENNKL